MTQEEVALALVEACPSAAHAVQEAVTFWDDDEPGSYLHATAVARHIVDCYREGRTEEYPAFFRLLERVLEGDHIDYDVDDVGQYGIILGLLNSLIYQPFGQDVFEPWLLPLTVKMWSELVIAFNFLNEEREPRYFYESDTLFGNLPIKRWPEEKGIQNTCPWTAFVMAREMLRDGNTQQALIEWQGILETPHLRTHHYLQAWHFIRQQGVTLSVNRRSDILGVVREYDTPFGPDIFAVYADRTMRYYYYGGDVTLWERPDDSMDGDIEALLNAASETLKVVQSPPRDHAGQLALGHNRISLLTPNGIYQLEVSQKANRESSVMEPIMELALALNQKLSIKKWTQQMGARHS